MSDHDLDLRNAFRQAMRNCASTVSIVSVQNGLERHATTATSLTSLSMDPPTILVCFTRSSRLHTFLEEAKEFCVNVLHADNLEVSKAFSQPLTAEARFACGDWESGERPSPYLANAQANLFCRKEKQIAYASHTIFIGQIIDVRLRSDPAPLLYYAGAYTLPQPSIS